MKSSLCAILALIGVIGAILMLDSKSCTAKWAGSGLKSEWGMLEGCLVQIESGAWIPEDSVREIDVMSTSVPKP